MTVQQLIDDLLLECEVDPKILDAEVVFLDETTNTWKTLQYAPVLGAVDKSGLLDMQIASTAIADHESLYMVLS